MGFYETQETKQETFSKSLDTVQHPIHQITQLDLEHLPKQIQMEGWDLSKSVEENIQTFSRSGTAENNDGADDTKMAVHFSVDCPHCGHLGHNDMCEITIPGFRKCIIMAFVCDSCGSRSNEVKPTGAYSDKGRKWTLYVNSQEDLNRDILKSHTASISLPSIDFEMLMGSLGGVFTTLEGLLLKIRDNLTQQCAMFLGDSASIDRKDAYDKLMDQLLKFATEPHLYPFTFIMDDAADFSMIGPKDSLHKLPSSTIMEGGHEDIFQNDENLKFEYYERSQEQNDDLGISDMVVENYEESLKENSENVV
ncbi:zinc finger protein ZPR1 homolog [Hylaeus volcanicus]|uniref:zinc finger protein ZPR1 homolog n=1 Tax=Hylaeus volcanicus TaxID=313075 RepID=UPI0023B784E7|nr:zinc finger protein ZPR1 homolog [Hylaeus volcanicus]